MKIFFIALRMRATTMTTRERVQNTTIMACRYIMNHVVVLVLFHLFLIHCIWLNTVLSLAPSRTVVTGRTNDNHHPSLIQRGRFTHDGFQCTYRYQPAITTSAITGDETISSSSSSTHCCLLIHPVGIGLGSWYWENMMVAWQQQQQQPWRR
jgi:hypothetical protein